jgi:hypothetical protein
VGVLLITGTPENVNKIEKYFKKVEPGHILIPQLLSLLFGIKITLYTIAFYINLWFRLSAILFSLLVGYKIFGNGYVSALIFLLLAVFRNSCQGLLYGLPYRYTHPVVNSLVFLLLFYTDHEKKLENSRDKRVSICHNPFMTEFTLSEGEISTLKIDLLPKS